MSEGWDLTQDWTAVLRLHRERNPGLYELADQYSHLRPSDLTSRGFRAWVCRQEGRNRGFALATLSPSGPIFQEIWCECTGLPSWWASRLNSEDEGRLRDAAGLLSRVARDPSAPLLVRVPADNAFGLLLARRLGLRFVNSLLLAVREPSPFRVLPLPPGYAVRPGRSEDAPTFHDIHTTCFEEDMGQGAFTNWLSSPASEAFAGICHGEVVAFVMADRRRGGRIGDMNLAVEEGHRGRGLGTALLERAMRSFSCRGVRTVVADHWGLNAPAAAFYRKHGFRVERVYHFFRLPG